MSPKLDETADLGRRLLSIRSRRRDLQKLGLIHNNNFCVLLRGEAAGDGQTFGLPHQQSALPGFRLSSEVQFDGASDYYVCSQSILGNSRVIDQLHNNKLQED